MKTNDGKMGLYKNRKPYCEMNDNPTFGGLYAGDLSVCKDAANKPTGLTCKQQHDCATGETCDLVPSTTGVCVDASGQPIVSPQTLQVQNCTSEENGGCGSGNRCERISSRLDVIQRLAREDEYKYVRFGDLPRACTPGYFEFVHSYTCGAFELANVYDATTNPLGIARPVSSIPSAGARRKLNEEYDFSGEDLVCVFVPKVQAMDNWGWCNGVNADGSVRAEGWYNNPTILTEQGCETSINPYSWTPYKGQIIVVPNR